MAEFRDFLSLFPAQAGVIQVVQHIGAEIEPFPRTGGGDPNSPQTVTTAEIFSPHRRG